MRLPLRSGVAIAARSEVARLGESAGRAKTNCYGRRDP